jgi:hypothetical protein
MATKERTIYDDLAEEMSGNGEMDTATREKYTILMLKQIGKSKNCVHYWHCYPCSDQSLVFQRFPKSHFQLLRSTARARTVGGDNTNLIRKSIF